MKSPLPHSAKCLLTPKVLYCGLLICCQCRVTFRLSIIPVPNILSITSRTGPNVNNMFSFYMKGLSVDVMVNAFFDNKACSASLHLYLPFLVSADLNLLVVSSLPRFCTCLQLLIHSVLLCWAHVVGLNI